MTPLHWAILSAIAILVVGIIFGVAGIFLAPILGVIATVIVIVWLMQRRSQGKPPIE